MPLNTINDIPLPASSPIQWALRGGVKPVIMEFDISPSGLNNLKTSLGPSNTVTLKITLRDNKKIEVKNLYYLGNSVGANPHIKKVIIADRRWLWNRHAIFRRYNIRRHSGVKRLEAIDVQELQDTAPEVRYANYSVKTVADGNVVKWEAKEIVEDIIKELVRFEKDFYSGALDFVFRGGFKNDIPIENLRIDDSGASALNKTLSLISGSDVFIDYDGRIIIYDKTDLSEKTAEAKILSNMLRGNTPIMVNTGNVEQLDKSFLRPKEIRVMFHREIEVRFDATETTGTTAVSEDKRNMENVISLPDWTLETDVQGTWVEIAATLEKWNALSQPAGVIAEFSMAYFRKAFVPFIDFWSAFLLNGVIDPGLDRDWAARVSSVMRHWRKTFRINQNWVDRVARLKAYRVSTIDRSTGQRSPAIAYANYCQVYTMRSFIFDLTLGGSPPSYITNIEAGLTSDTAEITSDNKATPAKVSILDEDQGIVDLDFLGDVYKLKENTIPGVIGIDGSTGSDAILTSDISRAKVNAIAFDAIGQNKNSIPEVIDGVTGKPHVTTIILTTIPASPNDNRLYHVVVKKPNELKELPKFEAKGPPIEIIVGSSIETARVRWLDSRKEDIEKLFGIGLTEIPKPNEEITLSQRVDDLVINRGQDGADAGLFGSLEEIAKAVAYKVYLSLVDRIGGSAGIDMQQNMVPRGYIDEVSQEINPDGVTITRVTSPIEIPEIDLFGSLDENSRAVIMKLAEVGK